MTTKIPTVRTGGSADLPALLGLLDGAVEWLVARGITEQWGSERYSASPVRVAHVEEYLRDHTARIAEDGLGRVIGVCVLADRPPSYVEPLAGPEIYLRLLVTDRARSGSGIGAALVADAREIARERGLDLLRVDCYAGAGGRLVDQYRRQGFRPTEAFSVQRPGRDPWPGQVLAVTP
jgi:GNAT superfamily N-acetyltransferase